MSGDNSESSDKYSFLLFIFFFLFIGVLFVIVNIGNVFTSALIGHTVVISDLIDKCFNYCSAKSKPIMQYLDYAPGKAGVVTSFF